LVKYKVNYDDDRNPLSEKFRKLVKAHWKYLKDTDPAMLRGEGRVRTPKGVIEWEADDFYEDSDETA
jgi:hypothetical protein